MKGQNIWILLLVSLQTAFVFCQNSSSEISSEKQNGTGIYEGDVIMSSSYTDNGPVILRIALSVVSAVVCLFLVGCICYRCCLRCGDQTRFSGLILSSGMNQGASGVNIAQQVIVQQASPSSKQNDQYIPQQNQPAQQSQYPPTQQFPPYYLPTQQFPPHNYPVQQFPPQNQPTQQFSAQQSPMKQFSPQHSPMQQLSQQNQPMQQFSQQNQPTQQFSQQHSPMQQFQGSETAPQYQFSPESEAFSNFPAAPPPYQNDLPPKY